MVKLSKRPERDKDQQRDDEILRRMLATPPKPHGRAKEPKPTKKRFSAKRNRPR